MIWRRPWWMRDIVHTVTIVDDRGDKRIVTTNMLFSRLLRKSSLCSISSAHVTERLGCYLLVWTFPPHFLHLCLWTECDVRQCSNFVPSCPAGHTLKTVMEVCCFKYSCGECVHAIWPLWLLHQTYEWIHCFCLFPSQRLNRMCAFITNTSIRWDFTTNNEAFHTKSVRFSQFSTTKSFESCVYGMCVSINTIFLHTITGIIGNLRGQCVVFSGI